MQTKQHSNKLEIKKDVQFFPEWIFSQDEDSIIDNTVNNLTELYDYSTAFVIAKAWLERFKSITENLKDKAINSLNKEINIGGKIVAKITEKSNRKYTYDDNSLNTLYMELENVKNKIKEREIFLQSLKNEVADVETGEIIKPAKLLSDGITINVHFTKK